MKKWLPLFILVSLLVGCNEEGLTVEELKLNESGLAMSYFQDTSDEPGTYAYFTEKNELYFFLNQVQHSNLDINVESEGGVLSIYVMDESREDLPPTEDSNVYKLKISDHYETIRLFINGEETYFNGISGE